MKTTTRRLLSNHPSCLHVTCVDTFMRYEVGLVLRTEAAGITEVGTHLTVRHRVLLQRPFRGEAASTHRALKRLLSCNVVVLTHDFRYIYYQYMSPPVLEGQAEAEGHWVGYK